MLARQPWLEISANKAPAHSLAMRCIAGGGDFALLGAMAQASEGRIAAIGAIALAETCMDHSRWFGQIQSSDQKGAGLETPPRQVNQRAVAIAGSVLFLLPFTDAVS